MDLQWELFSAGDRALILWSVGTSLMMPCFFVFCILALALDNPRLSQRELTTYLHGLGRNYQLCLLHTKLPGVSVTYLQ